jgi:fibronectin-binding autotransporter adhesin
MNLLKAWNAIAARAKNRPQDLKPKRRSTRRALHEQLEDRRMMTVLYWDPNGPSGTPGQLLGGDGTWDTTSAVWYDPASGTDVPWSSTATATFQGSPGNVNIPSSITADSIQFTAGRFVLGNNSITLSGASTIDVASGLSETMYSNLNGAITKTGAGTLTLSGYGTSTGSLTINQGRVDVAGTYLCAITINPGGTLGGQDPSYAQTGPVTNDGGTFLGTLYHVAILNPVLDAKR